MNEETETTADVHNVVIVGSGVAGLSAAVYAARADLEPLVLEGPEPGGQLTLTTDVENYLGFSEGIGGMELIQNGKDQATRFGAEFTHGTVENATLEERPFELERSNGDVLQTRALIVASGASARWVGAENEDELMGYGLSTCATCDGAFHRGDDVLVIGGGDSAMEEALFLAKFADSVTVVHRREELRASEIMADRARDNEDIEFRWNTELEAIHGSQEEGVTGATLVSHPDGYPARRPRPASTGKPSMSAACSTRSVTRPTPSSSRRPLSNATKTAISTLVRTTPAARRLRRWSRASSPPATSPIRTINRRSPPLAPAAWQRLTPKRPSRCSSGRKRPRSRLLHSRPCSLLVDRIGEMI